MKEVKRGATFYIDLGVEEAEAVNTLQAGIVYPPQPFDLVDTEIIVHQEHVALLDKLGRPVRDGEYTLILQVKPGLPHDLSGSGDICRIPFLVAEDADLGEHKIEFDLGKSFALKRSVGGNVGADVPAEWVGVEVTGVARREKMVVYLKVV